MPDFAIEFDIAHSLGAKRAANELPTLPGVTVRRIIIEADVETPEGVKGKSITTVTDNNVNTRLSGSKPFYVFDKWIRARALTEIEEALKGESP